MPARQFEKAKLYWAGLPLRAKGWVVAALPLVSLLTVTFSIYVLARQESRAEAAVRQSLELQIDIERVSRTLTGAETAVRGYVLTGRSSHFDM